MKLVIVGGKEIYINKFVVHCVFGLPNVGADPAVIIDMKEGAHHSNELCDVVWSVNSNISVTYIKKDFG